MRDDPRHGPFRDAQEESSGIDPGVAGYAAGALPAYRLAFADPDFLCGTSCAPCGCSWNC
jgi:hypothetical protein